MNQKLLHELSTGARPHIPLWIAPRVGPNGDENREMAHMYILECVDGSFYVGSTTNLEIRLWQHQEGLGAAYTKRRRPIRLVFAAEFDRVEDAFAREKQVQGRGRAKRIALINGDLDALPALSVRKSRADGENGVPE